MTIWDRMKKDDESSNCMLFSCEFCGEKGMGLEKGKLEFREAVVDCVVMRCVECGVVEPCEGDDLIGFLMELTGEKTYHDAIISAMRIVWKEIYLKEMIE